MGRRFIASRSLRKFAGRRTMMLKRRSLSNRMPASRSPQYLAHRGGNGGTEDFTGLSGNGRYLRINGIKRSSPYGYSIFEMTVWGPGATAQAPSTNVNAQLTPVRAVASASERADLGPEKAIDNNLGTRWASAFNDQQWIYLDFGAPANFSRLKINWENAYGKDYDIQVSNDASTWTTIKSVVGSNGGIEDMTLAGSGRYLRINGIKRSSQYGYSMFELAAWGTLLSGSSPAPTPTPAPAPTLRQLALPSPAKSEFDHVGSSS